MPVQNPFGTACDAVLRVSGEHPPEKPSFLSSPDRTGPPDPPEGGPGVYISTHDYGRLETLVHTQLTADHPVVGFLRAELERAVVRPARDLPADAVRMNGRVLFRLNGGHRSESRVLVYPQQYHPTGQYLSILSPLGVALLGLREGSFMSFRDLGGAAHRVLVEKVVGDDANFTGRAWNDRETA